MHVNVNCTITKVPLYHVILITWLSLGEMILMYALKKNS